MSQRLCSKFCNYLSVMTPNGKLSIDWGPQSVMNLVDKCNFGLKCFSHFYGNLQGTKKETFSKKGKN